MNDTKKILVGEDELTSSILLKRILTRAGYSVVVAYNGIDAISYLEKEHFDALLTDWMMPQMDGIELIRRVRQRIRPVPLIIMITALVSEGARNYALESGADDYIAKPIDVDELLIRVKDGLLKKQQEISVPQSQVITHFSQDSTPFICVAIATSTGGPPALIEFFKTVKPNMKAAYYIVQHGPPWMLETFSQRLQKETSMKVNIAENFIESAAGNIYIAPGDKHMRIEPKTLRIILDDGPKENFVRPSADPLFRSASESFGKNAVGIILTGLGRDGGQGAAQISASGGKILIQDPDSAVAPSMPKNVIELGIEHKLANISELGKAVSDVVAGLEKNL